MRLVPQLADHHDHGHQAAPHGEDPGACSAAHEDCSALLCAHHQESGEGRGQAGAVRQLPTPCAPPLAHALQEIVDVEQVTEEIKGLELTAENVETVRVPPRRLTHPPRPHAPCPPRRRARSKERVAADSRAASHMQVLDEIRPYLVGTGGGGLKLEALDGPIVKVKITGPAASVMTVRVAVTQKLREKIPAIAAVQLV